MWEMLRKPETMDMELSTSDRAGARSVVRASMRRTGSSLGASV